jgi:hypothetical protein
MSLDITLTAVRPTCVYDGSLTVNLAAMAKSAGLYHVLWSPKEQGILKAADLVKPLSRGLETLKDDPERFRKFDPSNGWGSYDEFIGFVARLLAVCEQNPDAQVSVSS